MGPPRHPDARAAVASLLPLHRRRRSVAPVSCACLGRRLTSRATNGERSCTRRRTGKTYEVPIEDGAVNASAFKQMHTANDDGAGLMVFDPAFTNTAVCRSAICYIDGDRGILRYRGTGLRGGHSRSEDARRACPNTAVAVSSVRRTCALPAAQAFPSRSWPRSPPSSRWRSCSSTATSRARSADERSTADSAASAHAVVASRHDRTWRAPPRVRGPSGRARPVRWSWTIGKSKSFGTPPSTTT